MATVDAVPTPVADGVLGGGVPGLHEGPLRPRGAVRVHVLRRLLDVPLQQAPAARAELSLHREGIL